MGSIILHYLPPAVQYHSILLVSPIYFDFVSPLTFHILIPLLFNLHCFFIPPLISSLISLYALCSDEKELKSSMLLVEDAKEDAPLRSKSNPFQDVPHDKKATVFKQSFLKRKAHADIDGKRSELDCDTVCTKT